MHRETSHDHAEFVREKRGHNGENRKTRALGVRVCADRLGADCVFAHCAPALARDCGHVRGARNRDVIAADFYASRRSGCVARHGQQNFRRPK